MIETLPHCPAAQRKVTGREATQEQLPILPCPEKNTAANIHSHPAPDNHSPEWRVTHNPRLFQFS
jgi:hypothetical protein